MKIVPIAFCFDNNLVYPASVCLSTLLMNANSDTFYDIFILHSEKENIDKTDLNKVTHFFQNCRIQYRTVGSTFDDAYEIRGITTPAYYRLLIPELIPEYDKILYSDVDVTFRCDLSDVYFNTDMSGYYLAGVDSLADFQPEWTKYYNDIIGIGPKGVIYSGNLLFNSRLIRQDGIVDLFKKQSQNAYVFQDMDVLNIVCRGKIKYMPPSFCLTTYISEYIIYRKEELLKVWNQEELDDALINGIVHYNGNKPWKDMCINFDLWWSSYRKTPFFDEKRCFDFFKAKINELDRLPFWKRVKLLIRYFVHR